MSSLSDFVFSSASNKLLPYIRSLLEDVVYDALNDREVPNRTDYAELRDLVNKLRAEASSSKNKAKKSLETVNTLQERVEKLEKQLNDLAGDEKT